MWNEVKVFSETIDGITYELFIAEPDFSPKDSFDDDEMVSMIYNQSEAGNQFAWFDAELRASFCEVSQSVYLGCNSYSNLEEFLADQYYTDMKQDVLDMLVSMLKMYEKKISKYLETVRENEDKASWSNQVVDKTNK
jgi:hypothetical protein